MKTITLSHYTMKDINPAPWRQTWDNLVHFASRMAPKLAPLGFQLKLRRAELEELTQDNLMTANMVTIACPENDTPETLQRRVMQEAEWELLPRAVALFCAGKISIEGNIARSVQDRKVMAVYPEGDKGKHAVTHYKVRERFGYVTLVDCVLETGRTHQIRCHMKYIKHPLFNDATYGGDRILKGTTFTKYKQFVENCFALLPRQALHAATLGFDHPRTHKRMHFESPMPADMEAVLEKWRTYSKSREFVEEDPELTPKELREKEKLMNLKK